MEPSSPRLVQPGENLQLPGILSLSVLIFTHKIQHSSDSKILCFYLLIILRLLTSFKFSFLILNFTIFSPIYTKIRSQIRPYDFYVPDFPFGSRSGTVDLKDKPLCIQISNIKCLTNESVIRNEDQIKLYWKTFCFSFFSLERKSDYHRIIDNNVFPLRP